MSRNVLIVVLDSVRKDTFDERADRLAELADVSFERCYAPSSWSLPSHASMFAGTLPHRHGVHSYNRSYDDLESTFLDELPHRSFCVSANVTVSAAFDFDALFDESAFFTGNAELSPRAKSIDPESRGGESGVLRYLAAARQQGRLLPSVLNGLYVKFNETARGTRIPKIGDFGANAVGNRTRELISEEPFVGFLNYIDAHGPLENLRRFDSDVPYDWHSSQFDDAPIRHRRRDGSENSNGADPEPHSADLVNYRDLYGEAVEYLDAQVAALIEDVRQRTSQETTVVVTADHGEELGLPGEAGCGHNGFSTPLLHVPCVVVGADAPEARVTAPTSLLDLGRIVHAVVEDGAVPDVTRDLVPAERIGMWFLDEEDPYWTRGIRTVYEGDHRFEWDTLGEEWRYSVDRSADGERRSASIPDPAQAAFDGDLNEYVEAARRQDRDHDIDERTIDHLDDLGYVV